MPELHRMCAMHDLRTTALSCGTQKPKGTTMNSKRSCDGLGQRQGPLTLLPSRQRPGRHTPHLSIVPMASSLAGPRSGRWPFMLHTWLVRGSGCRAAVRRCYGCDPPGYGAPTIRSTAICKNRGEHGGTGTGGGKGLNIEERARLAIMPLGETKGQANKAPEGHLVHSRIPL
jgi:hypothetical protein